MTKEEERDRMRKKKTNAELKENHENKKDTNKKERVKRTTTKVKREDTNRYKGKRHRKRQKT
jgi:hypothetical protein